MLSTIRETITSLKDKSYGNSIVTKRIWSVIWYWTKYLLVFTIVPWLMFVFMLTYFLPQLPRVIQDNFPSASFALNHGEFTTDLAPGTRFGDKSFSLIIDTHAASPSALNNYDSGVLIASTSAFLKSSDGSSDSAKYPADISFSSSKSQILSWVSSHQSLLWLIGFLTLTFFALVASMFYWLFNLVSFAIGGIIFYLIARFSHRQLDYRGSVKLAIYAAVLPFFISALFSIFSNPLVNLINFAVFVYLGYGWIQNLPAASDNTK